MCLRDFESLGYPLGVSDSLCHCLSVSPQLLPTYLVIIYHMVVCDLSKWCTTHLYLCAAPSVSGLEKLCACLGGPVSCPIDKSVIARCHCAPSVQHALQQTMRRLLAQQTKPENPCGRAGSSSEEKESSSSSYHSVLLGPSQIGFATRNLPDTRYPGKMPSGKGRGIISSWRATYTYPT